MMLIWPGNEMFQGKKTIYTADFALGLNQTPFLLLFSFYPFQFTEYNNLKLHFYSKDPILFFFNIYLMDVE